MRIPKTGLAGLLFSFTFLTYIKMIRTIKKLFTLNPGVIIIPILLLVNSVSVFSSDLDSLKVLLAKTKGEEKVNLLIEISRNYSRTDLQQSLDYAQQACAFADSTGNEELIAKSLNALAINQFNIGYNQLALINFERYLEIISRLYNKNPESEHSFNKLITGYNNIGNVLSNLGEFNQSIESFLKAISLMDSIPEKKRNIPLYINLLNNLGLIYINLEEYEKAGLVLENALEISKKNANDLSISISLNNLGLVAIETGQYELARKYYYQAVEIGTKINDSIALGGFHNNLGLIFERQQQYDSSILHYQKSLEISRKLEYHYGIANTLGNIANIEIKTKRYAQADSRLKEALYTARMTGIKDLIKKIYEYQYDLYDRQNKFEEALNTYILYTQIKDSLFNEERSRQIAEMEARYQIKKQQRENELLKKDIEIRKNNQRIFLVAIVALLLLAFLLFVLFKTKARSLKNEKTISRLEKEKNEIETKRLEDQLFAGKEINRLQSEKLDQKNRELSAQIIQAIKKNDAIDKIVNELEQVMPSDEQNITKIFEHIKQIVNENRNFDKEWQQFKLHFEEVNPGFFHNLVKHCPGLTQNELKLCAYYRIKLGTNEIARILNITTSAVQKSRYRLRKKMNIPSLMEMPEYMSRF